MKWAPLIAILVMGGLFGWFAPDMADSAPAPVPAPSEQMADPEQAEALRRDQWNKGQVVLPRAGDGHFYAEVRVAGASSRMLVDTGASVLALTGEDAAAIGLSWRPDEVRPVARGASGPVYGVPVVLDRVEVGGFEARGVEAVVVPEGLGISLLGQSFLSQIGRVEIAGEQMVLGG